MKSAPAKTATTKAPKITNYRDVYTGKLGNYGPDQALATAPAAAPAPTPGTLVLQGVPGTSPSNPPVIVKIDNARAARPQTGLNHADIVYEEEVEWGITRFAAVYHSWQGTVGPVRSGRSTDISFLLSYGTPSLAYSGANPLFDQLLLEQPGVHNFSAARSSGYYRSKSKRAPSNLFTNSGSFVVGGAAPQPQFSYRAPGVSSTAGVEASSFRVNYPAYAVDWTFDGNNYNRVQGGSVHNTDTGQVHAPNIVVVETEKIGTGIVDSAGGASPEFVFAGQGRAWVYTSGRKIAGTWTRATLRSPAILTAADGSVIQLSPGRTWVQIVGPGYHS